MTTDTETDRPDKKETTGSTGRDEHAAARTTSTDAGVVNLAGQDANGKEQDAGQASPSQLNPLQVVSSVLAAGLGVQSSRNRERDFKQGRAGTFIVAGLGFTALFIAGVYTVVSLVLAGR
jgi:uncharacterized MAPEG superfamily protein